MPLFDSCIFVVVLDGGPAVAPLVAVTDLRLSMHVQRDRLGEDLVGCRRPLEGDGALGAAAVAG